IDINYNKSLIYKRVLREEYNIPIKINLYKGFLYYFWNEFGNLDISKQRMRDSVDRIR
ncbi:hypothetical protein BKA60DRAFT_467226, partial [Fusarium oxysporum]